MRPLLLLLTLTVPLLAQDPKGKEKEHDSDTVRYRDFPDIISEIAAEAEKEEKALVVWLVDNAAMLKSSKHGELLGDAIGRAFKKPKVFHAVMAFGETPKLVQKAVEDPVRAGGAIAALAAAPPDNSVKNVCLAIREASKFAAGFSGGKKFLVLFTQENADNEDDVEGTLKALKGSGIVFFPIIPEAVYSDPYWESALNGTTYFFDVEKFKKMPFKLKGPEAAFVEFPYGFPFTWHDPTYTVPSGYAPWAIDRLATYSGGRSFLYSVDRTPQSFCQRYGCLFCAGEHKSCGASYDVPQLKVTQPFIGSRNEYGARHGKDRLYGAALSAWDRLHKEGILRAPPPLKSGGGALSENVVPEKDPARPARASVMSAAGDWKAQRQEALKHAETVEKAANELIETGKKAEKDTPLRTVATADALVVHLKLLSQAYRQFAAYCEEVERPRPKKPGDGVTSSDFESITGERIIGTYWQEYYLCHGGGPLKEVKFLGDPKALHEALDLADRLIEKHRGTPWELLMRRASLPVFNPIFEVKEAKGGAAAADRVRPRSTSTQTTTETAGAARPQRPVTADPGRGSGTATQGGGR